MPKRGYIQTQDHKVKATLGRKGKIGKYIRTEQIREKIRQSLLGRKLSEERKQKISQSGKGRKFSEEHKIRLSDAGRRNHDLRSEIAKKANAKRKGTWWVGEKNPKWKGGKRIPTSFYAKRRRVRISNCVGSHSYQEWEDIKKLFDFTCPVCGKSEPNIKLHKDHIVALSQGGTDFIYNIQPLCKICNLRKQIKPISYPKWGERIYA